MTSLLILLIGTALFLYGLKEYWQIKLGMKPCRTPEASITYLSQLLERSAESGSFLDLSCGYGGVVLGIARLLPTWQVVGVERSPTPWLIANMRSIGKNYGNYRFFLKNPLEWPLRDYSVIFLHQEAKIVKQWESVIARRLQPGTLFISYNAPLPRIKPLEVVTVDPGTKLYVYKKPQTIAEPQQTLPIGADAPVVQPVAEDLAVTE